MSGWWIVAGELVLFLGGALYALNIRTTLAEWKTAL